MWWFTRNNTKTLINDIRTVLNFRMCHRNLIFVMFWWCFLIGGASAQTNGDGCDWNGSCAEVRPKYVKVKNDLFIPGLPIGMFPNGRSVLHFVNIPLKLGLTHSHHHRAITSVYLRCSAGKISWLYPRGALRILLRLPNPEKNFRACIKMKSIGKKSTARIFLEGPKKLIPLVTDKEDVVRCFNSKNGQAALYVEASQVQTYQRHLAEIEYDLQEHTKSFGAYNPQEECRPCTMAELAHAFCTSELVTRGIITGVEQNENEESTHLKVKVSKVIHTSIEENRFDEVNDEVWTNEVAGHSNFKHKTISINIPHHCGVTHGTGEFVFMARKMLGDLSLQCAPRIEHWAMLVHKMNSDRSSACVLKS